jgi:hypothetical protein
MVPMLPEEQLLLRETLAAEAARPGKGWVAAGAPNLARDRRLARLT